MATNSSILAWEILWTEEPGRHSPWGCKDWDMTEHTLLSLSRVRIPSLNSDFFHQVSSEKCLYLWRCEVYFLFVNTISISACVLSSFSCV